ncbi:GPN-loop GTPase QQT2-like [Quercus robur]|uniref:GPN-loop GTPase QQT2-like n=1 Tax=Quercus robur TaxID=38942 RepID=UPI00216156F6|nr:GPN-loop GTPase QQT2-like [Quercus robur]
MSSIRIYGQLVCLLFLVLEFTVKAIEASAEADLDKRWAEKQRLEEDRRKENFDKLRKDMEKSGGETVVLSTGLKDKGDRSKTMMDEEDEEIEDDDDDDYEIPMMMKML